MNNNFHIRSLIGEEATCWHISANMVSVNWDSGVTEHLWKKDLDKMVKCNGWEYIGSPDDKLPKSFKFVSKDDLDFVYTLTQNGSGYPTITWEPDGSYSDTGECASYHNNTVRQHIRDGDWIIVPEQEPEKNFIDTLQLKIEIDGVKEAYEMLDEMVAKSNTVLESIKDFTSGTGHEVWIAKGVYKVFRQYEDVPYIARDEGTLMEIMNAVVVLDSVETE